MQTVNEGETTALRMVQLTELALADEVDVICRRHGLRYSLAFGSLIGAVRHKGFIPWDDDIDFLMPRTDFEEFLRVAPGELPGWCEVQDWRRGTSKRYVLRIADSRTIMRLGSYAGENELPVWLDIFVVDGIPDGGIAREMRYLGIQWRKAMASIAAFEDTVNLHRPGRPAYQQAIISICAVTGVSRFLYLDKALKRYDRTLRRFEAFKQKDCCCGVGSYGPRRQTWPSSALADLIDYEFEGRYYLGPSDYHAVLSVTYRDYMTIPPEEERTVHHINLLRHPLMARDGL